MFIIWGVGTRGKGFSAIRMIVLSWGSNLQAYQAYGPTGEHARHLSRWREATGIRSWRSCAAPSSFFRKNGTKIWINGKLIQIIDAKMTLNSSLGRLWKNPPTLKIAQRLVSAGFWPRFSRWSLTWSWCEKAASMAKPWQGKSGELPSGKLT